VSVREREREREREYLKQFPTDSSWLSAYWKGEKKLKGLVEGGG
jgi:hypothetical protein